MKKYRLKINNHLFEIEIEEIADKVKEKQTKRFLSLNFASTPTVRTRINQDDIIVAPMPGKIIALKLKPGDSFKRGDALLTLEAMKMENEIMAMHDGIVREYKVIEGSSVRTGDALVLVAYK